MNRSARRKLRAGNPAFSARLDDSFQTALDAERSGNQVAAIVLYQQCLAESPGNAEAYFRLAGLLRAQGDIAGAVTAYQGANRARPRHYETLVNLAETLRQSGRASEALAVCTKAIEVDRKRIESLLAMGLICKDLGDLGGAIEHLQTAIRIDPRSVFAHMTLARVLIDAGRRTDATAAFETASRLEPHNGELHRLLATLYHLDGRNRQSLTAFQKAIELDPEDGLAYSNMAGMLSHTTSLDLAVSSAQIAIKLLPTHAEARFNFAAALEHQGRTVEAIQAYMEALACDPELGDALVSICRLKQQICDWTDLDAFQEVAPQLSYRVGKSVPPFGILSMTSSPSELLLCARVFAGTMKEDSGAPLSVYAPRPLERRGARIRIGYLSADLQTHATTALIAEIFELHDRSAFETFAYSIGRRDESDMRQRLVAAFDHFNDLSELSHSDAAAAIRADEIDILIDLKGYTFQSRPQILARRPAPIQVNFLGYPGSMGCDFIDYLIGDSIVTPADHFGFYDEQIVTLPNSYQPNDRKRVVAAQTPTRGACGLPNECFVFCCFNANYKLTPTLFDRWMRILAAVPGSVLWLLQSTDATPENLCGEATARGIDPRRLVFAPKLAAEDHLARMRNGDLFLDTQPVGAHTTASEALWVGLPVLTCLGEAFAARVGSSLLHAVGLPELVMPSMDDYEATAIRIARDPALASSIRAKLGANLPTAPLFDAERFTKNLESAYARMIALRDEGKAPHAFAVTDCGTPKED